MIILEAKQPLPAHGVDDRVVEELIVLTGPPQNRSDDHEIVRRFFGKSGRHVVCGGTTARIVARSLGRSLTVDLSSINKNLPPKSRIDGIDFVSEGILTLMRVLSYLRNDGEGLVSTDPRDTASDIVRLLEEADGVHFIVGLAQNPANLDPKLSMPLFDHQKIHLEISPEIRLENRLELVCGIAQELEHRGTKVILETV